MGILQILLSLTFLTIASAYDVKTREVPNKIWIVFMPLSIVVTVFRISTNPEELWLSLVSIVVTTVIAVAIFYLGLYGGADAKALMTLAVAHPTETSQILVLPVLPLSAFQNSLLLMAFMCPIALVRNLYWKLRVGRPLFRGLEKEPAWKRTAALFLCVKKSKSRIKPYDTLAERLEPAGVELQRTLRIFQRVKEEDTVIDETIPEEVFVTHSLPMLPFLTLGYLLAISVGDLILHLVAAFLR